MKSKKIEWNQRKQNRIKENRIESKKMKFGLTKRPWFTKNGMSFMNRSICLFTKIELVHQKQNGFHKNRMSLLIEGYSI